MLSKLSKALCMQFQSGRDFESSYNVTEEEEIRQLTCGIKENGQWGPPKEEKQILSDFLTVRFGDYSDSSLQITSLGNLPLHRAHQQCEQR